MTHAFRALIFLIPIFAWAQPAGAPEPTVDDVIQQQITARAMELIKRSSARNAGKPTPAMLASEADAVKQAVAEALAAKPAAAIPAPPVTSAAPPVISAAIPAPPAAIAPVVVTAPTQVSIPQDIRDSIVSLCSLLITAGIMAGLAWMRAHFAFMKDVGINASVTSTANGLGALLERELAKQGKSLTSVSISDPTVAAFAQKLVATYPEWGPQVGLTQDIAERKVMAGAIQQSSTPLTPTTPMAVPAAPTAARQNPAEPGRTSPPPPPAATSPDPGVITVTAQAVSPAAVPAPPPTDLEVHP